LYRTNLHHPPNDELGFDLYAEKCLLLEKEPMEYRVLQERKENVSFLSMLVR
jgi:hypothetical protein